MSRAKEGARVALSAAVVCAWVAAAVAAWVLLPPLGGSTSAPLSDIVPPDAQSIVALERSYERFGSTFSTDTVVVRRDPRGLGDEDFAATARAAFAETNGVVAAVPLVNAPIPGVHWGETGTTALTYLFLDRKLDLEERERVARSYAAKVDGQVTGAGPARLQQYREIDDALPIVEAATVVVILVIVALYFRSLGAPLVTLLVAAISYVVAVRVLAWAGEIGDLTVPSEIEPVLVVLLLGLVTDYTVFFMSEARRRLRDGEVPAAAARGASARIAPIVITAGVLVAGATASLVVGRTELFRVFGPGLAASALVVTLVCVTLVPALLTLGGARIFGRLGAASTGRGWPFLWSRPGGFVLAALGVTALVIAALGARSVDLVVSHIPSLPPDTEVRHAADDVARGLMPGLLAPTEIVVSGDAVARDGAPLGRLQDELEREPGVAGVLGPAQAVVSDLEPLVLARDGGAARFAVFLDHEPTGARAIDTIARLRSRIPELMRTAGMPADAAVSFGGESALAQETVDALTVDLGRIALATVLVTFVLLAFFLRALVAPLLLLAGSVLAFAASFGLTALLLKELSGDADVVYYVPLVGAVLLVAIGSDYNVFIAARINEEARRAEPRDAIAAGGRSASRAIAVAGITLAATFALLALVPLQPFRHLALLMSLGVLVDALFVRPLLIPALLAAAGRSAWWPRG